MTGERGADWPNMREMTESQAVYDPRRPASKKGVVIQPRTWAMLSAEERAGIHDSKLGLIEDKNGMPRRPDRRIPTVQNGEYDELDW